MDSKDAAPSTLRDLVEQALVHQKVRYLRDLERIAERNQLPRISHTTLAEIRKGTYRSRPSEKTLETLAGLAGVPFAVAHRAAGLGEVRPPFRDELPKDVDLLEPAERQALIGLMRVMVAVRREQAGETNGQLDETYGISMSDLSAPSAGGNEQDTEEPAG